MNAKNELTGVYQDLKALADPVDLVEVLDQPRAPDNRSALTCWIGAEMRDPRLHNTTEIGEISRVRWEGSVGSLVAGCEFLKMPWLESALAMEDAA